MFETPTVNPTVRAHSCRRWLRPGIGGGMALTLTLILAASIMNARRSSATTPLSVLPANGRWVPTSLRADTTALLTLPGQPATLLAATTSGVWRSTNAGANWQPDGSGMQGRAVFVLAGGANHAAVWAGGFDGTVYMRDASGGRVNWRRISPVLLTDPSLGPVPVYSLAVLPLENHSILAGGMGAISRGEPTGAGGAWRWRRIWQWQGGANPGSGNPPGCFGQCSGSGSSAGATSGGGAVTSLLVAPWDRHLILASLFQTSPPVLVSHDGQSWASYAANLPPSLPVQDLAAGNSRARQVFLTTMGGGVWQREAGGPWQDISTGLPQRHAMPLVAVGAPPAGVLYAGTMASGVYEKVGNRPWRPLGRGLTGSAATVVGLAETSGARPGLLAATTSGVFRYMPEG